MALENVSVDEAFRRFTGFVQRETAQFFAYVGIRLVLGLAGYFGLIFAYEIVLFLLMAVVGIVCGLIGLLLHAAGVPNAVLIVLGIVTFALFMLAVNFYVLVLALGPFFTFFEAHTLYFLGGRYPMLGELLERSTPPAAPYVPPPAYAQPYDPSPPISQ